MAVVAMVLALGASPMSAQPPLPPEPLGQPASPPAGDDGAPQAEFVPGEILVKFKPAVGQLSAQNLLTSQGLQVTSAIQSIDVLKVNVPPGQELEAIDSLRSNPNVLYAEPNYIAFAVDTDPNDYYYVNGYQWGLGRISAPAAWDINTGSSDVVIAVVDTGIDLDHPDLSCSGKLVTGRDFVNPGTPPDDDHGHGTHVAGIAAACTNNVTGVAGLAWGARLMPVKVLDSSGNGSYARVAEGMTYAANHNADIINLSLGGLGGSSTLSDAVEYAHSQGVLVVAAAGNCGGGCWIGGQYYYNPDFYPAAYPDTMAVAATNSADDRAYFSGYRPYVDVAAPGVSIYSTLTGGYGYQDGTSMATPYVAGLAALVWSLNPGLTPDQVRDTINSNADDLGTPGKDDEFGYGRINAWRALESLLSLETSPAQASFLIDDENGSVPASIPIQVTTTSPEPINWTATVSPPVAWLDVAPPDSGTVSAASADNFVLVVPSRPSSYGTYKTSVIVTGTTASGGVAGVTTTEVTITYVPGLHTLHFPIIFKKYTYP